MVAANGMALPNTCSAGTFFGSTLVRIAFVDLLFSWPPRGGASVDLYHSASELQRIGHTVHLFGLRDPASWERGVFEPEQLPFGATRLDLSAGSLDKTTTPARIRELVDAWGPDIVIVCDGFFLKPYIILALAHHRVAARYYAHEMACHRDILRFKEGAPCPNHYLHTPELCRKCALDSLGPGIRSGSSLAWTSEYLAAEAYGPAYYGVVESALRSLDAAIVYNPTMASLLEPWCPRVHVVPGGVDPEAFPYASMPGHEIKTILMTGRAEDPAKGLGVLLEAGKKLRERRQDFEVVATAPEDYPGPDWFRPAGWREHGSLPRLYAKADVVVAPSVWDEPFGMVALEAMAVGRPVCASKVGGLQTIVEHTKTGFLFERNDSTELSRALEMLIDNPAMATKMGLAGRSRVEEHFTWERVVRGHFGAILAHLLADAKKGQA